MYSVNRLRQKLSLHSIKKVWQVQNFKPRFLGKVVFEMPKSTKWLLFCFEWKETKTVWTVQASSLKMSFKVTWIKTHKLQLLNYIFYVSSVLQLTSTTVPFVITPSCVYIGDWGFFLTPMIGRQKVAFNCKLWKHSITWCTLTTAELFLMNCKNHLVAFM